MIDLLFGSIVLAIIWCAIGFLVGWIGRFAIYLAKNFEIPEIESLIYNITMMTMTGLILVTVGYLAAQDTPHRASTFIGEMGAILTIFAIFYPGFLVCHFILKKSKTHQKTFFEKFWFSH
ncbi:MAG: hypothetical protein Q7R65_04415 [bacterium]|nr:hypothetical protein [bacterium]